MDLTGKIINNCYYVKEKHGEGLYTINWRAKSLFSDFHVNLKFLKDSNDIYDAASLLKLKEEIYKVFNTYNVDIEKILEIDEYNNYTYIAAESINGITLKEYLEKKAPLTLDDIMFLIIRICQALEYIHHQNIIHKNLNPSNIWIITHFEQIKVIKLADFAFLEFEELLRKKNKIKTTHWCMAPEVIKRDREKINETSDIFSAGCLLYWLLTKTIPYKKDEEKYNANKQLPPPSAINKDISPVLDLIVLKAIHPEQSNRYKDNKTLLKDLIRFNTQVKSTVQINKEYLDHPLEAMADNLIPHAVLMKGFRYADNHEKYFEIVNHILKQESIFIEEQPICEKLSESENKLEEDSDKIASLLPGGKTGYYTPDTLPTLKAEDINFFKRVLRVKREDIDYLKKQFYYLINSKGNMLLLEYISLEYIQLIEYFKDFFSYNNSIIIEFDCQTWHEDYNLYYSLLVFYIDYLKRNKVNKKKLVNIVLKKYKAPINKLVALDSGMLVLFEHKQNNLKHKSKEENEKQIAHRFIHLLQNFCSLKSSIVLLIKNITYLDLKSKKLLYNTQQYINSLPVLILGVLS